MMRLEDWTGAAFPAATGSSVLDTHVHFWDTRRLDYPWLGGVEPLDRPFLAYDYPSEASAIFVQADCVDDQALDEARWVAGSSVAWRFIKGIVAGADLRSERLDAHLDALRAIPLVVGVRHLLHAESEVSLSDPALARGLRAVRDHDLTFDACVRHEHLGALADLIDAIPGLRVVIDHVGKPPLASGITSEVGRRWAAGIARLADQPNVYVKLSGLPAESPDRDALDRHAAGFVAHAVGAFGPERSMLGSDWPVSTLLGGAEGPDEWTARVQTAVGLDPDEWDAVSQGAGSHFYGLDTDR